MENRFVLGRRIAEGGMAEVFAARMIGSEGFAKDVVVKRVLPQLARDPDFISRFLDEARLAAQLSHPGIVQVLQLVVDGDDLMMAMEPVDGADLSTLLKKLRHEKQRLPLPLALRIASGVAGALAYAHEKRDRANEPLGIIHRDVTPSNILVSRDGATKLIDFGIARARSVASLTRRGAIVGKVHYLSPEQVRDQHVDARVDIWSCGVVLFQMIAGTRPFVGDGDAEIFRRIAEGERVDVRAYGNVPEALARIVDGCLAIDRDQRVPTARALAQALDEVIAKDGLYASAAELGDLVARLVPAVVEVTTARADGLTHTAEAAEPIEVASTMLDTASTWKRPPRQTIPTLTLDEDEEDLEATSVVDRPPTRLSTLAGEAITDARAAAYEELATLKNLERRPRPSARSGRLRAASLGAAIVLLAVAAWRGVADEDAPVPEAALVAVEVPEVVASEPTAPTEPTEPTEPVVEGAIVPGPRPVKPKRREETGTLVIDSRPWSKVRIDGVNAGPTPIAPRTIAAGTHTLVLENDEQGLKKTMTVVVKSGKTTTTRVDLRR